jgi:hypothetical protein
MRAHTRVATAVVGAAMVMAGCTYGGASPHPYGDQVTLVQRSSPDYRPWFCNAAGNGTPLSGHGNGSHVNPIYEGQHKGPLGWDDCVALGGQLDELYATVTPWNTRAKGEAAGWKVGAEYISGLGSHHSRNGALAAFGATTFDIKAPQFLIYGGTAPDSPLVGVAYSLQGKVAIPPAFVGTNDWWHHHGKVCADFASGVWPPPILAGAEEITDEACTAMKAVNFPLPEGGLNLLHLWINPPYEYRLDLFASGHNCLLATGVAPQSDPCWDIAHRDPALGLPPGTDTGGDDHGAHGH